jgi:hypothetical protein
MAAPELNIRRFKGLRLYLPKSEKGNDELSRAENVMFDSEGILTPRYGIRHQPALTSAANGTSGVQDTTVPLAVVAFASNSTTLLILRKADRAWYCTGVDPAVEIGGVSIQSAPAAVVYDSKVWFSTGKYLGDGVPTTAVSGMPSGLEVIIVHKDRLWVTSKNLSLAGVTPFRIYYSEPGAPLSGGWPAANFIDVRTSTPNRGMESYRDAIYIFKPESVWVLNTAGLPANWTLRKLGNQGSIGASCVYKNVLYWLGEKGLFSYNGVEIQRLSDPVQEYFDDNVIAYTDFAQIVGYEDNLWISFFRAGAREYWLYNVKRGAWSQVIHTMGGNHLGKMLAVETRQGVTGDNLPVGVWWGAGEHANANLKPSLFRTDETVFSDKDHSDVEKPFTVLFETAALDFDEPLKKKRLKYLSLEGQFSDLTIDQFDEEDRTKQKVLAGFDATKVNQVKIPGIGFFRRLRIRFSATTVSNPFKILGIRGEVAARGQESAQSAGTYANSP